MNNESLKYGVYIRVEVGDSIIHHCIEIRELFSCGCTVKRNEWICKHAQLLRNNSVSYD